jgi:hypothetical protein
VNDLSTIARIQGEDKLLETRIREQKWFADRIWRENMLGHRTKKANKIESIQRVIVSNAEDIWNSLRALGYENDLVLAQCLPVEQRLAEPASVMPESVGEPKLIDPSVSAGEPELVGTRPPKADKKLFKARKIPTPFGTETTQLIYKAVSFLLSQGKRATCDEVINFLDDTFPEMTVVFGYWDDDERHSLTEVLGKDLKKRENFQKKLSYVKCCMKKFNL